MKSAGSVVIQAKVSFIAGFGTIQSSFTPFISVPPGSGSAGVVKHIVFIIKENRSFDNYFGTYPGANGATTGKLSTGQTIALRRTPYPPSHDISHQWRDAHIDVDARQMAAF